MRCKAMTIVTNFFFVRVEPTVKYVGPLSVKYGVK